MSEAREASPTPSERTRKDAEDRKREEEEQSKLPYKWTQTLEEVDVTVPIPGNLKARDLVVELKKAHVKVGVRGQEPIIDVSFFSMNDMRASLWYKDHMLTIPTRTGRLPPRDSDRRLDVGANDQGGRQQGNRHQPG